LAYSEQLNLLQKTFINLNRDDFTQLYFKDKSEDSLNKLFTETFVEMDFEQYISKGQALSYMGYLDIPARRKIKTELINMMELKSEPYNSDDLQNGEKPEGQEVEDKKE
jgi:hypothetical protein